MKKISYSKYKTGISYNEEKYVIQRKKIQNTKQVSITMKKLSYSKYKTGINYNEENNLFIVQKRCVFRSLHK